jgi:hypothetical protein
LRRIHLSDVLVILRESNVVKPLHEEGGIISCHSVRKILDSLLILLEKTTEGALLCLPDVHVFTNVEGSLNVSNQEGVLSSGIDSVEYRNSLSVTSLVLGEGNVLILPVTSFSECSPVPHASKGINLISRDLNFSQDVLLESIKFFCRESNI